MIKKFVLMLGIIGILFIVPVVVKAAPSSNPVFATIEYVNQLISDTTSLLQSQIDALTARLDIAEDDVDGLDTRVTDLENVPSPSPTTQKELKTFDNDGNELGLFISRTSFLYVPLGRIVVLSDAQIGARRNDVWYQSTDCTGQAYAPISERDYWSLANEIYPVGPGKYYMVDRGPGISVGLNSLQRYSGGAFPCLSASTGGNAWSLTPVTLPFSEPIALPLEYKYE